MQDLMPGRKSAAAAPPAELEARPGDIELPTPLYVMKSLPGVSEATLRKNPGTLRLRLFRRGEAICVQGEPGWTAFLLLTADDLRALPAERARLLGELPAKLDKARAKNDAEQIETIEHTLAELRAATELPEPLDGTGPAATVFLDTTPAARPTLWQRWFGTGQARPRPRFINIDAPTPVDYGTRRAELSEGALFGEVSCQYGTPRSATIVAARDCYVLEMLRNILGFVLKDEKYRARMRVNYVAGVLQNHLAGLSFLADLTPEQLAEVREGVTLESYKDGQVIFDRGDAPDYLYIVRRGLVKVLLNDWPLLTADDIRDPAKLKFLGEAGAFVAAKLGPLPKDRDGLLRALNAGLKWRDFTTRENEKTKKPEPAPALKPVLDAAAFRVGMADMPAKSEDWSDQEWRRFNRLVLEWVCPGALRPVVRRRGAELARRVGSEDILTYMTQGDFFGEIGAVSGSPRSA
ncbi:MAG: hypothetical protein ACRC33_09850, partial [Gemmataceae bacterium]